MAQQPEESNYNVVDRNESPEVNCWVMETIDDSCANVWHDYLALYKNVKNICGFDWGFITDAVKEQGIYVKEALLEIKEVEIPYEVANVIVDYLNSLRVFLNCYKKVKFLQEAAGLDKRFHERILNFNDIPGGNGFVVALIAEFISRKEAAKKYLKDYEALITAGGIQIVEIDPFENLTEEIRANGVSQNLDVCCAIWRNSIYQTLEFIKELLDYYF